MALLMDIITNRLFIGVVVTLILAQIIKAITNSVKGKKFSLRNLVYGTGGMPSSHAAAVTCLTAMILLTEGITPLFVVSLVISLVIIRDAVGVRLATGEQAEVINELQAEVWKTKKTRIKHLKESIGHTPVQVIAGIVLGLAVAFLAVYL